MLPNFLTAEEFSIGTGGAIAAGDPRVEPLLAGASAAIRRYCGWHVGPATEETLTVDGPGSHVLSLPTLHIVTIESVAEYGRTWTPADVESLEWSEAGMVRTSGRCWTSRYRGVAVTLTHGFEDIADVKQIVQQVVGNAISSPMGATREQAGQVSISWSTTAPGVSGGLSLLQRDLDVLNFYRLPGRA